MKKTIFAIAAIATLLLASCVKEVPENGENIIVDENALAFSIKGMASTRAVEAMAPVSKTALSLGQPVDGEQFYLEETLTTLDGVTGDVPATRGTPAYTGNVATIYKAFNAVAYPLEFVEGDPAIPDGTFAYNGKVWQRSFSPNPLDGGQQYYLFARMPADQPGVVPAEEGGPKYTYAYDATKGYTISFNYTSPATAAAQTDILFAGRQIQKSDFNPTAPILFHHVLSGVKFATANHQSGESGGTRTVITKVEFVGLKGTGTCTVTPQAEGGNYVDIDNIYSSANAVKWEFPEEEETGESSQSPTYSQEFNFNDHYGSNVYKDHYDYETTGKTNDGFFPDSFYGDDNAINKTTDLGLHKTTDWNINDKDASLTFWFIPQEMTDNVKMKVTFYVEAGNRKGEEITREVQFGTQLGNVEWKAGQLRTYVIKATEVAVTVEDQMVDADTKQMVQIRNTGNVPEWVRATVVANWCAFWNPETEKYVYTSETERDGQEAYDASKLDSYENIAVYGFTGSTGDTYVYPWDLSTEIGETSGGTVYGQFNTATLTEKADGSFEASDIQENNFPGPNWVKGDDGYYYYTQFIGVDQAATQPLFYQYIVNTTPTVYLLNKALTRYQVDVHLVMNVVVQAILAPGIDEDTTLTPAEAKEKCNAAWNTALDYTLNLP